MLLLRSTTSTLCLLPLLLTACGAPSNVEDPRAAAPRVRVATVAEAAQDYRSFTGVVTARVQSHLGFRVGGKVLERFVDVGEHVHPGQRLMRLDPTDLDLQARASRQAVASAKARAVQTASDERRNRELVSTGAISATRFDRLQAEAEAARAALSAAQAEAVVADNRTRYAVLTADVEGVVVETSAEPGQVVSAGQRVMTLAQSGAREAWVQLPETMRPALGSLAQARSFDSTLAPSPATLRQLSDAADPITRTFEARYVLQGANADAPLGSTVTLRLVTEPAAPGASSVPLTAVYDAGRGPGLWVVTDTSDAAVARVTWRPITLIGLGDDSARVQGVAQGERVVALGAHLLHEGEQVVLEQTPPQTVVGTRP